MNQIGWVTSGESPLNAEWHEDSRHIIRGEFYRPLLSNDKKKKKKKTNSEKYR